jgi:hypothetical protein
MSTVDEYDTDLCTPKRKHLCQVISLLPSPNMVPDFETPEHSREVGGGGMDGGGRYRI